ncbi:MAG: hypothetical protein WCP20_01300 [Desulfuromonadales bacterium]
MAQITEKYELLGIGSLLILIGILSLSALPIGTIIGIFLIIWGVNLSKIYRCTSCGNRVESKEILVCPSCREKLGVS